MTTSGRRILFKLTDDALVVGNTGKRFTKRGLAAIVYGCLTTKADIPDVGLPADDPFLSEDDAKSEIARLFSAKSGAFSTPEELASQIIHQDQTAQSYSGRALLELFQNAVDASRESPIGYKGVGFRSILKLTDAPSIHSHPLHVHWSPNICQRALTRSAVPSSIVLCFPEWCVDSPSEVRDFDTSITLPLSAESRAHLLREWNETVNDPSLLVFIDGVEEVRWESTDGPPKIWSRKPDGDLIIITETCDGSEPTTWRWRLHSCVSRVAMVAVPECASGRFTQPSPVSTAKLRAFFPTEDSNPFPNLLVHAEFPLTPDRKHIDTKNDDFGRRIDDLAEAVKGAVERRPEADVLDLLMRTPVDTTGHHLIQAVWKRVREHPVALLHACPEPKFLPSKFRWDDSHFEGWELFKECLTDHRPGLEGLHLVPVGIENKSRNETLHWLNPNSRITKEELQALPWAPVEGSTEPVVSLGQPLFEMPKGNFDIPSVPTGVRVHFLNRAFQSALEQCMGEDGARSLLRDTLGVRPFTLLDVVERAILPVINDGAQPEGTIEFLQALWRCAGKDREKLFDWNDHRRAELTRKCRVRCNNDTMHPAEKVYAGSDWTNSDYLERVYGSQPGYAFLHSPPENESDRKESELFYRWLGIGWAPKVCPLILERASRSGWKWSEGRFIVTGPEPFGWRDYCMQAWAQRYQSNGFTYRTPRLKIDWTLDGGLEVVEQPGAFEAIRAEWSYYEQYVQSTCNWSSNQQQDYDNDPRYSYSYFIWRLRQMRWLAVADDQQLQRPVDTFRPGGVTSSRFLSGWVFPVGSDFPEKLANALGIRRDFNELTLEDWKRWLAAAAKFNPQTCIEDRHAIRRFYDCLLTNAEPAGDSAPLKRCKVWWIERLPDKETWTLTKVQDSNGAYLDRPEHESLLLPGVTIFPARLDEKATKAEALFGMSRLSKRLLGVPNAADQRTLSGMTERIKSRSPFLIAYLGIARNEGGREKLRADLQKVSVIGTTSLKITWKLDGELLATVERPSFAHHYEDSWHLYLQTAELPTTVDPAWERLAEVILLACGFSSTDKAANVRDILTYDEDRLTEKLTNLGVAPETVTEAQHAASEFLKVRIADFPINTSEQIIPPPNPPVPPSLVGPMHPPSPTVLNDPSPSQLPTRPHPETGLPAQEWLRRSLAKALQPADWQVSAGEVIVEEGGSRIDIRLQPATGEPFYIEAKHTSAGTVYWSKLQIETARNNAGRYFVALLHGTSEETYEVRWVFDPLNDFGELPRGISWTWGVRRGAAGIGPYWEPLEPPPMLPADGFKAVIMVGPTFLAQLPFGIEALGKRVGAE